MKLAIFASAFHPHLGGVEELVRQQARLYIAQGDSVCVLTDCWPRSLPHHEVFDTIPIYRFPFRIPVGGLKAMVSYYLTHAMIAAQVVDLLRRQGTQLIHVQCVSTNGYYARLASAALGIPLVITTQGERTMDAGGIYQRSEWMRGNLKACLEAASYVTGCSLDTLDDVRRWSGDAMAGRSHPIPNGISLADFKACPPYAHPVPYILGIGRLVPQKGFDVLVRAFDAAGLEGMDLLLAGGGPEEAALKALAAGLSSRDRIHFLGPADRPMAVSLFTGCAMFCLPSRLEPFGIVNLEAMAASRPVIASRTGGVPDVVADGETGLLVPPDDVDSLRDALVRLASDADLRERLGRAGRQRAESFDWQEVCRQYRTVYDSVLSIPTARRA